MSDYLEIPSGFSIRVLQDNWSIVRPELSGMDPSSYFRVHRDLWQAKTVTLDRSPVKLVDSSRAFYRSCTVREVTFLSQNLRKFSSHWTQTCLAEREAGGSFWVTWMVSPHGHGVYWGQVVTWRAPESAEVRRLIYDFSFRGMAHDQIAYEDLLTFEGPSSA